MSKTTLDWTHTHINIIDIRKVNKLYVIIINSTLHPEIKDIPLFVNERIFEERLKSYFLKDVSNITRDEILCAYWNMYITKGYYIKIAEDGTVTKFEHDPNKWFISYLEISGPLGSFFSIHNNEKLTIIKKE